jgi:hypothetical protein
MQVGIVKRSVGVGIDPQYAIAVPLRFQRPPARLAPSPSFAGYFALADPVNDQLPDTVFDLRQKIIYAYDASTRPGMRSV